MNNTKKFLSGAAILVVCIGIGFGGTKLLNGEKKAVSQPDSSKIDNVNKDGENPVGQSTKDTSKPNGSDLDEIYIEANEKTKEEDKTSEGIIGNNYGDVSSSQTDNQLDHSNKGYENVTAKDERSYERHEEVVQSLPKENPKIKVVEESQEPIVIPVQKPVAPTAKEVERLINGNNEGGKFAANYTIVLESTEGPVSFSSLSRLRDDNGLMDGGRITVIGQPEVDEDGKVTKVRVKYTN